jgi:hypothetical protein
MKKWLGRLTGIGISLLFMLILLEILLQLGFNYLPQPLKLRMPQYPLRYGIQFDTPHGAREYPAHEQVNVTITAQSGDLFQLTCLSRENIPPLENYTLSYQRDEHGFRNISPWPEDVDLVVTGDSFTAAETIQHPYWEGLAESELILGLPGSGTAEQGRLLTVFGLPRHPETVIVGFFGGNDMMDSWRFEDALSQGETLYSLANKDRKIWEYSVLFQILMLLRPNTPTSSDCPYPVEDSSGTPLAFYPAFLEFAAISQDDLATSSLYALSQETILGLNTATEEAGAEFILLYIPHKAEVYWPLLSLELQESIAVTLQRPILGEDGLSFGENPLDAATLSANLDAQRTLLAELAAQEGFTFLDLTPIFREAAANGASLYFYGDTHWNQTGHDLAREAILAFLRQN